MDDEWKIRAENYNKIDWVSDEKQIENLLEFCDLKKTDNILDAGCGTGILLPYLAKRAKTVVAFDKSIDMLKKVNAPGSVVYGDWDIQKEFDYNFYDKIISRMVFHHVDNLDSAFKNCYRALNKGGLLIIEEGISPSEDERVIKWTSKIRDLKEKRNHFTSKNLTKYFEKYGFKNIELKYVINKNFSINNWLKNSWKDPEMYNLLLEKHLNAPDYVKDAYNMRINKDEIMVETKILFIKGQK